MKNKLKLLCSALFILLHCRGYAQTIYKTIDKGPSPEIVSCVEKSDGGFLLVAETEIPYTNYFFLINLSATGQVTWTKRFDFTTVQVLPIRILKNADSTFTILLDSPPIGATGDRDCMLIRIDDNGNMIWKNTFGEDTAGVYDTPYAFSGLRNGGFAIAGQREMNGTSYPCLMVTDSAGTLVWAKSYDPYQVVKSWFNGVQQTPDGGFIACGESDPLALLMKTDSVGNILWMKKYAAVNTIFTYTVNVMRDSSYLLYGFSIGIGNPTTFLIKVDRAGNTLWEHHYNFMTPYIKCFPVYELSDGTLLFMSNISFGASSNTTRFAILKADASGNLLWCKQYHPAMKNVMSDMQLTGANGCIASGYILDTTTFDQHGFFMKSTAGIAPECFMDEIFYLDHTDSFTIDTGAAVVSFTGSFVPVITTSADVVTDYTLCGPAAVAEIFNQDEITIVPNPASGEVYIMSPGENGALTESIVITDEIGREVLSKTFSSGNCKAEIDVSQLPAGFFLCKVDLSDGKSTVKKLLVTR